MPNPRIQAPYDLSPSRTVLLGIDFHLHAFVYAGFFMAPPRRWLSPEPGSLGTPERRGLLRGHHEALGR